MKLLQNFTDQLARCGDIQRVWLTSFNMDIEFIESFILPAVLGAEQPRTRMDYEALQLELSGRGIDFRVFCDNRYISTDQNKRTLIPVHGISPGARVEGKPVWDFSEDSLFHAKVIYLEGKDGRILGAGSANLTLSGWGRNREVFHFIPVDEVSLYRSAYEFFRQLFRNVNEDFPLINHRTFPRSRPRARFCHSFQDEVFLTQLLDGKRHQRLAVWSPYLARDLAGFIDRLKKTFDQPDLTVCLVADRVDGQYLRTKWSEELDHLFGDRALLLYQFPLAADERVTMTHAKLWKTEDQLAIGSWNCTGPGSNSRFDEKDEWLPNNNIEAGLILRDKSEIETVLGKPLAADAALFASDEQLKAESLDVPETLPFDLRVTFDWSSLSYRLAGNWNRGKPEEKRYSLKLPDINEAVFLTWMPVKSALKEKVIPVAEPKQVLTDHRFEILRDGKSCGTGLLIELSAVYRRAQQYDDLKSLFDAMAEGGPEPSMDDVSYRVAEALDGEVQVDGRSPGFDEDFESHRDTQKITYFRLFSASFQYATTLREIKDIRTLDHWVFTRPGCLEELVKKTNAHICKEQTSVFNWFLAQEVSSLCHLARRMRDKVEKAGDPVPLPRWQTLGVTVPRLPPGADDRYLEALEHDYERMSKNWGAL